MTAVAKLRSKVTSFPSTHGDRTEQVISSGEVSELHSGRLRVRILAGTNNTGTFPVFKQSPFLPSKFPGHCFKLLHDSFLTNPFTFIND
jgi:hypothetical protein